MCHCKLPVLVYTTISRCPRRMFLQYNHSQKHQNTGLKLQAWWNTLSVTADVWCAQQADVWCALSLVHKWKWKKSKSKHKSCVGLLGEKFITYPPCWEAGVVLVMTTDLPSLESRSTYERSGHFIITENKQVTNVNRAIFVQTYWNNIINMTTMTLTGMILLHQVKSGFRIWKLFVFYCLQTGKCLGLWLAYLVIIHLHRVMLYNATLK